MKQISLLHIGDIHFSRETSSLFQNVEPLDFEKKDWSELSDDERKIITPYIIRAIKRNLYDDIENEDFCSVILTGDLCDKGDIIAYETCLNYLTCQCHNFSKRLKSEQLCLTAGNHDINSKYDPKNLQTRFEIFLSHQREKKINEYSTGIIFEHPFEINGCKILLLDINSCFEFGNISIHKDTVKEYIQKTREREGESADLNKILNVPYISDAFFDSICEKITKYPGHLPIIYTHHNLFPMREFTEGKEYDGIINCGSFQERLYSLKRPILFVHGHIHDNPIDIHESPDGGGKIILISAPLFFPIKNHKNSSIFGYNIIKINFSDTNPSQPLSCEVHLKKFDVKKLILNREKVLTIPFYDSLDALPYVVNTDQTILNEINLASDGIFLKDLINQLKEKRIVTSTFTKTQLVPILEQLNAINLIRFRRNQSSIDYSMIKGNLRR